MAVKDSLLSQEPEQRDGKGDLVEDVVVVITSKEKNPDGGEKHSQIGTQSIALSKNGSWDEISFDFDIDFFALIKASGWIISRSIHINISSFRLEPKC